MSAETLRRAAALMRERAEGARYFYSSLTMCPGAEVPWPSEEELRLDFDEEQAPHIASWHPAVALAVADQLDGMAAVVDEAADGPLAIVAAGLAEKSLAVARTYLGERP